MAARLGWRKVGSTISRYSKGATYEYRCLTAPGWVVQHCGHPTAICPYYAHNERTGQFIELTETESRADRQLVLAPAGSPGTLAKFRFLEEAMQTVEELTALTLEEMQRRAGITTPEVAA